MLGSCAYAAVLHWRFEGLFMRCACTWRAKGVHAAGEGTVGLQAALTVHLAAWRRAVV